MLGFVHGAHMRRDLLLGKLADRVAEQRLVFGERGQREDGVEGLGHGIQGTRYGPQSAAGTSPALYSEEHVLGRPRQAVLIHFSGHDHPA